LEIGRESTPGAWVAGLVDVFREVRRLLTDDGTLWVNVGNRFGPERERPGAVGEKQLLPLAWLLGLALQEDGWILRADIVWEKENCIPSPVIDRPTIAHEYVLLLSKGLYYFYDADAVREPHGRKRTSGPASLAGQRAIRQRGKSDLDEQSYHPLGRSLRSVWTIAVTAGTSGHGAPMPEALARRCILAGSAFGDRVLDPFGGSGTVARVAAAEGRGATLIELDERAVVAAEGRTIQGGLTLLGGGSP
jgi:site-specific DNA-methyltransferase (adenine-specific)